MRYPILATAKQPPMPRVLTAAFSSRLALANMAIRKIKAMGYQVLSVSLDNTVPCIQVSGHPHPAMRKLTESGRYAISGTRCTVFFNDAHVWWQTAAENTGETHGNK